MPQPPSDWFVNSWSLTGKTRYRHYRSWGKSYIVLQVEVRGIQTDFVGNQVECETINRWRDATVEDIIQNPKATNNVTTISR